MKFLVVIAVICALFYSGADGLKCYECTSNEALIGINDKCFSKWEQVPLNECKLGMKYCQIQIVEGGKSEILQFYV
jgi:hypothetical protein